MLFGVQATFDNMVVKYVLVEHLEYTLEFVNDHSVIEELRQYNVLEIVTCSTTEQYPASSKSSKTEDTLNLSCLNVQLRFPECMIVLIKDDNGSL